MRASCYYNSTTNRRHSYSTTACYKRWIVHPPRSFQSIICAPPPPRSIAHEKTIHHHFFFLLPFFCFLSASTMSTRDKKKKGIILIDRGCVVDCRAVVVGKDTNGLTTTAVCFLSATVCRARRCCCWACLCPTEPPSTQPSFTDPRSMAASEHRIKNNERGDETTHHSRPANLGSSQPFEH